MVAKLPTRRPEGTPADIPALLLPTVRALAPDWAYRIVWSAGRTTVREKLPDQRSLPTPIGEERSTRTTRDVAVLVRSVSLRCRLVDGTAAYAYWWRLLDSPKWTFGDAGLSEPGRLPESLTWHEFRAGVTWIDEGEMAA